jgi:hypothetical protein
VLTTCHGVVREIPTELLHEPFSRERALALGVTSRMLEGSRFVRVHPRVWRHRDHEMTRDDLVTAARLALPSHAQLTGLSRIQQLGLDFGPRVPIRFVVEGDLHLDLEGIFLHRTVKLPETDDVGVVPTSAFIAYCAQARFLDAIKVGDWLLQGEHVTIDELHELSLGEPWRDGAMEALVVLEHLDGSARSLKESEVRALMEFAGLPRPETNLTVANDEDGEAVGDLVLRQWGVVVEYEGVHHQRERGQYLRDIGRYAWMRESGLAYVQVTHELLQRPRSMIGVIHRVLVSRGYTGPAPELGERWRSLFLRLTHIVEAQRSTRRGRGRRAS